MFPLNGVVNIARCERIIEADKNQLGDIVGTVPAYTMEFIDIAIQRAFGLRPVPKENTLEIVAPEPPFVFPIPEVKTVFNSSNLNNMPIPEDWTEDKKNELCDMYLSSGAMKTAKYFHLSAKEVTNYYHQFRKR
jgi:hypothetical protein